MRNTCQLVPVLVAVALLAAACGGSDDSDSEAGDVTTETAAPPADSGPEPESAASIAEEVDPSDAGTTGSLEIVLDDGRSWSLDQYKCSYTPDNEGRFVELWAAGGTLASSGGEFIVVNATPPDPADTEPVLSGSFVDDENGIVFVAIEGDAVSDGSTMTMTIGMHDSPNKIVGDPIDLTATVTCEL